MRGLPILLMITLALGCGDDATPGPAEDAGSRADTGARCTRDPECDDGLFCNGLERCAPGVAGADGRGCIAASPSCGTAVCEEATDRCIGDCEDLDGDGAASTACGGSDCDDGDARRYPGATEVCDVDDVDEDCDPTTYGVRDLDADGDVSNACCNGALCGTDCDDMRAGANPRVPEVCNGTDDDCDGAIDEGVFRAAYRDADRDGYGDPTMPVMAECGATGTDVDNGLDCDDADPAVRPGAAELCNGRDDNCDGVYDADVDGDGHLSPRAVCIGDALPRDDCNDFDADTYPGAPELCELRDNDCDGDIDDRADADRACRVGGVSSGLCIAGACRIASCAEGRGDCDGRAANGCEVSLAEDARNCGACGEVCGFGTACVQGSCEPVRVVDVDTGLAHTCFVTELGRVGCFGRNREGQLGVGAGGDRATPIEVLGLDRVLEVDAGALESCALRDDGSVVCWGTGQAAARAPDAAFRARSIAVSDERSWACAADTGGVVWCWGNQVIEGPRAGPNAPFDTGVSGAVDVVTSTFHTCARDGAGAARCWGMNHRAQLGDGLTSHGRTCTATLSSAFGGGAALAVTGDCSPTAVRVASVPALRGIAVGPVSGCAHDGATVWCWGSFGSDPDITVPRSTLVAGAGRSIVAVDAGDQYACAVRSDGATFCWGRNSVGQLGDGTTTTRSTPTRLPDLALVDVAASAAHTCGIDSEGLLSCWGLDDAGQLGDRSAGGTRATPVRVAGLEPATATAGAPGEMCARTRAGRVVCWGSNRTAPATIAGLEDIVELAGGGQGLCARDAAGAVSCWTPGAGAPSRVPLAPAAHVAIGSTHACAVLRGGGVRCWGGNAQGQLGDGTTTSATTPVAVPGTEDAIEIAAGRDHTCARRASGRVICWGSNDRHQLGDPAAARSLVPIEVPGIDDATQLVAGALHACALRSDGSVWCWGDDDAGQLGDGAVIGSGLGPRNALGLAGARALSAGDRHTCALLASASVWCWGSNSLGQSGQPDDSVPDVPVDAPTRVPGLTARAIGLGLQTSCAIDLGGGVQCWGSNEAGEVGDGVLGTCAAACVPGGFCGVYDCNRETPTRVRGM